MPGPGESKKNVDTTQQSTQNQVSNPWGPTQPLLTDVVSKLGAQNTDVTPMQSQGISDLYSSASSLPNFSGQAGDVATALFGSTPNEAPILSDAYSTYKGMLSPYLNADFLDPRNTPGFKDAYEATKDDITNAVNSQFAAAGRDLSPGNTTALARGLSRGLGQLDMDQYNKNVAAQLAAGGAGFGAGGTTATGLTGLEQTALGNRQAGVGVAGAVPGLATGPSQAEIQAAMLGYGIPYSNIGMLTSLLNPIAQLGGQVSSTGSQTGTQNTTATQPWAQTLGQLFPGAAGGIPGAASFALSDERVKDDIAPIGMLYDSTPVYSFRYKGDSTPRVGLMAQDVEQTRPDAVVEIGGVKAVDYGKATERARHIGMLHLAA